MDQIKDEALSNLLKRIKEETNKSIWIWSGYLYEDIIANKERNKILSYADVLIDGRFELAKRDISLKYRGSSNQRIIDIVRSRKENKIVEIEF